MTTPEATIDRIDRLLLDALQEAFPLVQRPWKAIADRIGITEEELLRRLSALQNQGIVRGVGPVLDSRRLGLNAGTLVALHIPEDVIPAVAGLINSYPEVSHNYVRQHHYSIWFTITAATEERISAILSEIQEKAGILDEDILNLPTVRPYKVDVRFSCALEEENGPD